MPAVSNTSPVFNLACIGRLELLRGQFGAVWIPSSVEAELVDIPDVEVRRIVEQAQADGWLLARTTTQQELVQLLRAAG